MLKKDGEDASRSSFPDMEWKIIGNFGAGRRGEFMNVLMT